MKRMKLQLNLLLLVISVGISWPAMTQNFKVTPENPKPGDMIEISYVPAGNIANTLKQVEGAYYAWSGKGRVADDLLLTKKGKAYTAKLQTDTSMNFIQLAFKAGNDFDTNSDNGYYVLLNDNGKPRKGAYMSLYQFYSFASTASGVERSAEKGFDAIKKEIELYPGQREKLLGTYLRAYSQVDKEKAKAAAEEELKSRASKAPVTETDYAALEMLYGLAKMPDKAKEMTEEKKKKFPNGSWMINDALQSFYAEKDVKAKEDKLAAFIKKIKDTKDWDGLKASVESMKYSLALAYLDAKQWDKFDAATKELNDEMRASAYNSVAWRLQEKDEEMDRAAKYSTLATEWSKTEVNAPTMKKPDYITTSAWDLNRKNTYAMYADTYGMVMYKRGDYAKGLPYAKEAAIDISEGKSADMNNTYALLADKVLSPEECRKQLEQFVRDGKATSDVKDILKKQYLASGKSETQFETYITQLEQESKIKMLEELKKGMLSEATPGFKLSNLDGKALTSEDLKGKVTIIDFWATWCGPCKASFPGMQKVVTKYKDNPNVQFFFVDSWENGDDKLDKVRKFIETNKYTFNVLMDLNDDMINKFKVEGIPTKFIVDKDGVIRFKTVGFDGNDEKLATEIDAMIEMAGNPGKI